MRYLEGFDEPVPDVFSKTCRNVCIAILALTVAFVVATDVLGVGKKEKRKEEDAKDAQLIGGCTRDMQLIYENGAIVCAPSRETSGGRMWWEMRKEQQRQKGGGAK